MYIIDDGSYDIREEVIRKILSKKEKERVLGCNYCFHLFLQSKLKFNILRYNQIKSVTFDEYYIRKTFLYLIACQWHLFVFCMFDFDLRQTS